MTKLGSTLALVLGLGLTASLVAAEVERRREPWRGFQERYQGRALAEGGEDGRRAVAEEPLRPHEITVEATGEVDRCTTCHLALEPGAPAFAEQPFRGHPERDEALHERHPLARIGCTACHGGQGRSLDRRVAHDRRAATGGWSAFTPPRARCGRCHAQGGARSPRGQRGAEAYLARGCPGCHQPGRSGPGIGPDLSAVGLRGEAYLRRAVLSPDEVYPQTVMPPMRFVLEEDSAELAALVTFLHGLEPWPRERPRRERRFDPRRCTACHHVDEEGGGWPPLGARHTCPFLHSEERWLRCDRCHGQPIEPGELEPPRALSPTAAPAAQPPAEPSDAASPPAAAAGGAPAPEAAPAEAEPAAAPRQPLPAAPRPVVRDRVGPCPVLEAAFGACGVCHREGER